MGDAGHQAQFISCCRHIEPVADLKLIRQVDDEVKLLTVPAAILFAMLARKRFPEAMIYCADQGRFTAALDAYLVPVLLDAQGCMSADVFSQTGKVDDTGAPTTQRVQIQIAQRGAREVPHSDARALLRGPFLADRQQAVELIFPAVAPVEVFLPIASEIQADRTVQIKPWQRISASVCLRLYHFQWKKAQCDQQRTAS